MKKILVADDDIEVFNVLEKKLSARGYLVSWASDGTQCLEKIHKDEPDLLILDILMPDHDGTEIASTLKRDPRFEDLPVIFLTALERKEEQQSLGSDIGGNIIFAKPFDPEEIYAKIREILGS